MERKIEPTEKRIKRLGALIMVQELDPNGEYYTISTIRTIDKINGKLAKELTDEELLADYNSKSGNWSL